jgi:hypothetical protein
MVAKQCNFMIENLVEQVFKVGTCCWLNIYSRSSMMIQKGDEKGNQNKDKKEELRATLAEKLFKRAHYRAEALVEIQVFLLFDSIFWYYSLILYHSNRNHTKFVLNLMEGVT